MVASISLSIYIFFTFQDASHLEYLVKCELAPCFSCFHTCCAFKPTSFLISTSWKKGTFCCKKVSSLQRYHTEINLSFLFATLHKTDKMVRPPCCGKFNVKRGLWTADEDAKILAHVAKHGTGNWTAVPKKAGWFIYIVVVIWIIINNLAKHGTGNYGLISINEHVLQDFKDVGRVADLGGLITWALISSMTTSHPKKRKWLLGYMQP